MSKKSFTSLEVIKTGEKHKTISKSKSPIFLGINRLLTGFGLIEVMTSIFILVVGISGAIVVLNNIVNNFRLATDVFIANNLAIEGIELVRNVRDKNLLAGVPWPHGLVIRPPYRQVDFNDTALIELIEYADGRLYVDANNFFQHEITLTTTIFRRRIEIINCPDITDCLEIRSIVMWTDIIGNQYITIVTRLFRGRDI